MKKVAERVVRKIGFWTVVRWIAIVFFVVIGFIAFIQNGFAGIVFWFLAFIWTHHFSNLTKKRGFELSTALKIVITIIIFFLAIATLSASSSYSSSKSSSYQQSGTQTTQQTQKLSLQEIVERVRPSVVEITISGTVKENCLGIFLCDKNVGGTGSGVVISKSGSKTYVLTNRHVVDYEFYAGEQFKDKHFSFALKTLGQNTYPATVEWIAPDNIDLAVVSFQGTEGFAVANPDYYYTPRIGDEVIVIGNPLRLEFSVSKGIVSNFQYAKTPQGLDYYQIQTDAPINPGNSGGGMFTTDGRLIGINSWKIAAQGIEGIGFAISLKTYAQFAGK